LAIGFLTWFKLNGLSDWRLNSIRTDAALDAILQKKYD